MTITILCPNGHKLACPDNRAGKGGKCPHCGATFRVPELSSGPPPMPGSGPLATGGSSPSAVPGGSGAGLAVVSPVAVAEPKPVNPIRSYDEAGDGAVGDDEIVFLCPNDHHLRAPASMMGQAGSCPVCEIEFLLPSPEDLIETEEADPVGPPAEFNAGLFNFDIPSPVAVDEPPARTNNLGQLVTRFWRYRKQGVILELHLNDARVLIPDGFMSSSATQSHGLFLVRETNGTLTVSAIDWEAVTRVAVRGLRELPGDLKFDM